MMIKILSIYAAGLTLVWMAGWYGMGLMLNNAAGF